MNALIWLVNGAGHADEQENPGLAPSRSSGGSRAANPYDAPRKHGAFHSSRNGKSQRPAGLRSHCQAALSGGLGRFVAAWRRALDQLPKQRGEQLDEIGSIGLG